MQGSQITLKKITEWQMVGYEYMPFKQGLYFTTDSCLATSYENGKI